MVQANVVGGSSQQYSLPLDAQRTVNYRIIVDQDGKSPAGLISRPGLNLLGTTGTGAGRGGILAANGRVFIVSGSGLYEQQNDGSSALRGALDQTSGIVTMADNGFQLAVCDQQNLYILTYATNVFQKVVTANLPSAASVTFIGGYFIVNKAFNSGIFQISAPYDGLTWEALDFATAESSPDSLQRVMNISGQLWLVGSNSIEIWSNTGAASFPFQRVNSAAQLSVGTVAPFAVAEIDNTMFWIGRNERGFGIVNRADGFSPKRVSNDAIELKIQAASDPSSFKIISYQEAGHTYCMITGGGMDTALVLDIATGIWTEDAYLNESGQYEQPLQTYLFYAFGKIIALDRRNGNVYEQSIYYYSDNGDDIARDRIFTHIFNKSIRFKIKNLAVFFETGTGNETVPNPVAQLRISEDGGRSFGTTYEGAIGQVGQFNERGVLFWQLGSYFQATFRLRVTEQIKIAINGAEFNV